MMNFLMQIGNQQQMQEAQITPTNEQVLTKFVELITANMNKGLSIDAAYRSAYEGFKSSTNRNFTNFANNVLGKDGKLNEDLFNKVFADTNKNDNGNYKVKSAIRGEGSFNSFTSVKVNNSAMDISGLVIAQTPAPAKAEQKKDNSLMPAKIYTGASYSFGEQDVSPLGIPQPNISVDRYIRGSLFPNKGDNGVYVSYENQVLGAGFTQRNVNIAGKSLTWGAGVGVGASNGEGFIGKFDYSELVGVAPKHPALSFVKKETFDVFDPQTGNVSQQDFVTQATPVNINAFADLKINDKFTLTATTSAYTQGADINLRLTTGKGLKILGQKANAYIGVGGSFQKGEAPKPSVNVGANLFLGASVDDLPSLKGVSGGENISQAELGAVASTATPINVEMQQERGNGVVS
ncbi:MAG: hypothetical protein SFT90_05490 [Rickettsiales bacterium]|nr:hypothetical protein [Rickettsiales bacterium]